MGFLPWSEVWGLVLQDSVSWPWPSLCAHLPPETSSHLSLLALESLLWPRILLHRYRGLPRRLSGKKSACQCKRHGFDPWVRKIPWYRKWQFSSVQWLSHVQLFFDPMDCSTLGLPAHHHLLEFTQIHVHWVSDAIQPSHPLSFPSPPALNFSHHQGLFKWVSSSHQVA